MWNSYDPNPRPAPTSSRLWKAHCEIERLTKGGKASPEVAGRTVAHLTDNEIVAAAFAAHGIDGFDPDTDADDLGEVASRLGFAEPDSWDERWQAVCDALYQRLDELVDSGRMTTAGCYGVRLTWEEAARQRVGKSAAEIAALLEGAYPRRVREERGERSAEE